jgi:hypothetical protein
VTTAGGIGLAIAYVKSWPNSAPSWPRNSLRLLIRVGLHRRVVRVSGVTDTTVLTATGESSGDADKRSFGQDGSAASLTSVKVRNWALSAELLRPPAQVGAQFRPARRMTRYGVTPSNATAVGPLGRLEQCSDSW